MCGIELHVNGLLWRLERVAEARARVCFTGTKVQLLAPEELLQLLPNYALNSTISEWLERNPEYKD
jgi:hypothetical protein